MKASNKIKQILVNLAANDKLPLDINDLDTSHFKIFDDLQDALYGLPSDDTGELYGEYPKDLENAINEIEKQ